MEDIYEYPLKQHLGEQVVPVVVDGDSVNRGQLVAFQRENTLGANLYSSVKGVVTKVTEQSIFIKAVGAVRTDPGSGTGWTGRSRISNLRKTFQTV